MQTETVTKEPIAIIGLGCVLPDAPDVGTFWNNLLEGKDSIREVSPDRWDPAIHWSTDKDAADKTYAKIGGFVRDDAFDGLQYRLPPKVVEQIDPCQRWALSATRQAFLDAGYATGLRVDDGQGRTFDRDRCAVIVGNAMGGELNKLATKRLSWAEAVAALRADPDFQTLPESQQTAILERAEARYKDGTLPMTEDTMPGHLSNVVAGRIANAFDLGGKNFTTDAACASSLAALDAAVATLRNGEADLVVWGGTDRSMDVSPYVQFSKIGALSPDGSRPFDASANGFVMGEGCAMFLLKRLSDAERDGDTVYAVLRGIGGSSDGKGKGITAPNPDGQVKAVLRAYQDAEVDPATLGYLEAHGTSTPVGDPVELESAGKAFAQLTAKAPAPGSVRVGSVKSNLGHLKSAAGAVGMLKAALALHHGRLPPSIHVLHLNPRIDWAQSPFRVQTTAEDWPAPADHPRRAAVSSFGFGGTNFHVVLEGFVPGHLRKAGPVQVHAAETTETRLDLPAFQAHMAAAAGLEGEPLVLAASDAPRAAALTAPAFPQTGEGPRLRDRLHPLTAAGLTADERVAFHVNDVADIAKKLALAQKAASDPAAARLAFQQGVFLGRGAPEGKVAFLFPGQGTQYVNMGRDLAAKYQVVADTFAEADAALRGELGCDLTSILWPTPDTPENRQASEEKLRLTEYTQPAVLAMDAAVLRLLDAWGIRPDVVAGHSLGEYGALVAAGVLSFSDALHAVAARGREMANVDLPDLGKMASISADWHTVSDAIADVQDYVICANKNCPGQTVIAGSSAGVDAAVARLQAQGLQAVYLPVSAAFHSAIVAPASEPLRKVLARLDVRAPQVRVLSNVGAEPYGDDPEAIRDNLAVQVASPVEWVEIVERMYAEGVRTFIEVGPKRALTGFVQDILQGKDVRAVFANHPKKGGVQSLGELYAFLGASGFEPALPALDADLYTESFRDPAAAFQRPVVHATPAAPAPVPAPVPVPYPTTAPTVEDPRIEVIAKHLEALTAELRGTAPATATPAATPAPSITVSGISVGLPGRHKPFFSPDNWDRILRGENLIDVLDADARQAMVDKHITRLVKSAGGQGTFESIDDAEQVIKLAGRRGDFDLREWGVGDELLETLDVTSQYAIAAGLEALHDAGLPLQRTYQETSTGGRLPKGWALPRAIGDETGIIFASAFPGYDALLSNLRNGTVDEAFNRKFLFHVLSMGHSQLAQFLGARGPNTQVNAACASTTQAIAIAEDWIKAGRCKRVLVVGADDATSPNLMEWIGSGFLASGAATTKEDVAEAALPFDARRHGMIIGMGAVGLVVEAADEVERRGMRPITRLLSTVVSNSAFHGSRLDVEHIAGEMQKLVRRAGLDPAAIAASTVFMSHETYTPARGGSAAAEIHALRATFGAAADKVVIANTKGFTGHPQGAGIEDAVVLKCLQRGTVPPIPHLRQPDPELGTLNLSKGGAYDVRYALRLAAGFGSQVAMTLSELVSREDARVADAGRYGAWLAKVSGLAGARTEVVDRTLRIIDETAPAKPVPVAKTVAAPSADGVLPQVVALVAEKTGYPVELLEPDLDMEADLGIDTVKQAELFGELRQTFGVPLDERLSLKEFNTLRKVAGYMAGQGSRSEPSPGTSEPQGGLVAGDVLEQVIALVAEKTGYPVELLEPDLDMEADLGIDTVKQAELFGELRQTFGVPLDESLSLKDYNTLRKVADYMGTGASEVADGTSGPQDERVPEAASDDVLQQVITLVAEKTGYPVDLLEPDLDMEADLGIDTVKQAELFGELRARFSVPMDESLSLKDYNTLRKVAGYMSQNQADGTTTSPAVEAVVATPADAGIHRLVPCLRPLSLPDEENGITPGPVLVVGDVDLSHLDAWKAAGFTPRATLDGEAPVGILCLATEPSDDPLDRAGALFDAAKAHPDVAFVATVTAQDGAQGLQAPRDAGMAALTGLTKALRKELPDATVKAIDLHPDLGDPAVAVQELLRGGARTEVAYGADGTRFVVDVAPASLPDAVPDVAGKALIVSGGAQGITAELLAALAPQGPKLLLLGRTPLPADAETWATWTDEDWKQAETVAIQGLRDAGETATPVAVQKVVGPMKKAADVQRNLQRLMDAGAEVLYASVDATDAETVATVVRWARDQFGRIDGIVHAAGIEISKMLADKPRGQFDTVFGIKATGLQNLLDATRDDDLSLLAGFGSVAGRFGNAGQTDYSAANDALAKAIVQAAQERGIPTAFTVAWGPWGELGMATRGGIMTVLRESGVTPIPTAEGTAAWLRELATPGVRECVVAGGLGDLDTDGQIVASAWDPALAEAEAWLRTAPASFRLLDGLDAFHADRLTARLVLDRTVDPYLFDHAVDGVPLLPGVFGLEAFAEAGRLLAPEDQVLLGATDVRFAMPLKQHKDEPVTAWVDAHAKPDGDGTSIACRLTSRFVGPDGRAHGEPRLHFEATLRFGPVPEPLTTTGVPDCDGTTGPDRIYPPFFHGPSFQVLSAAGPVTADEATGSWHRPDAPCFAAGDAAFLGHPLVTEGLFQLCGLRTLQVEGTMSLPAAIDAIDVWPADARDAVLWCRYTGRDDDGLRRFDAAACTDDGQVLVRLSGYGMVEAGPAPTPSAEGPEAPATPAPARATLADFDAPAALDEAPALPEVDGVVFAAVAVGDGPDSKGLTQAEQETATGFASRKRAAEWVAGRMAAKQAVLDVAPDLSALDITVENDEDGRPHLFVQGQPSPARLSLTHRDGWALAALADDALGIDLETIEPRSDAFWDQAFGAIEKGHLRSQGDHDLAAACAWAAKEACLKRQGTGLQTPLHDLHVTLDGPGATVSGPFGEWGVRFYDLAGRVLAVTLPAFDATATVATGANA